MQTTRTWLEQVTEAEGSVGSSPPKPPEGAAQAPITREALEAARRRSRRGVIVNALIGWSFAAAALPGAYLASLTASGSARYPVTAAWSALLIMPLIAILPWRALRERRRGDALVDTLTEQLVRAIESAEAEATERKLQARHQELETRLANALEMAEGEPEVIDAIERSCAASLPGHPVELLLADNSHAHLVRVATASPGGTAPACPVASPDQCPAARRARVQRFPNSEDLDACPKLRGRASGTLSAVCVPVTIMGHAVGVIHATGEPDSLPPDETIADLETLAKLAGARLGLLRVMSETQMQASTDSLTGLLNRRSFEHELAAVRRESTRLSLAMVDLDHFKELNDTHGHATGDRALRLFAQTLSASVRSEDLACRHGGEEFVIALVDCAVEDARKVLNAFRGKLGMAIVRAGLPKLTASFGLSRPMRRRTCRASSPAPTPPSSRPSAVGATRSWCWTPTARRSRRRPVRGRRPPSRRRRRAHRSGPGRSRSRSRPERSAQASAEATRLPCR
jgi:diguanylate cyclase (GGDEF)-like protein